MAVTQKVTLYNNKFTVPPVINAVQNDTDRLIEAYFGDFTLQVGMTGVLSFIRSDRTHYEVSATLDTATNTATAELDQALTQAGVTQAQLKITDSGNVGSTFTFMIKVQPDVAGISQQQDGYSAEELAQGIADNASAITNIENVELPKKADSDGNYEDMTVGTASGIIGKSGLTDTVPYTYRAIPHDSTREVMRKIVGATVGWNQLCNSSSVTVQSGHKYYMKKSGTESIGASDGSALTGLTSGTDMVVDLTQALGSTIADYVYSLETATAEAGVAWLKSHFPKAFNEYQPYDAGSLKSVEGLVSHDTVGFNQWDEEWEAGTYNGSTGAKQASTAAIRNANPISIISGKSYYLNFGGNLGSAALVFLYDHGMNYLGNASISASRAITFSTGVAYINFRVVVTTYNHDICINLSDPQRNGQYEPYQKHSYPLDPTQELRGIFKLDSSNNLYADGDEWYADGTKNVRYGIVDLGTLTYAYNSPRRVMYANLPADALNEVNNDFICEAYTATTKALSDSTWTELDNLTAVISRNLYSTGRGAIAIKDLSYTDAATFKTAMSGVYLVYELATPTESTAPAFADVQIVDPDGTEEFVTDCIVAVGNETFYADDLVGKLDDLPALPTTAGTYRLKVTVTAGVPSYEWVTT